MRTRISRAVLRLDAEQASIDTGDTILVRHPTLTDASRMSVQVWGTRSVESEGVALRLDQQS